MYNQFQNRYILAGVYFLIKTFRKGGNFSLFMEMAFVFDTK